MAQVMDLNFKLIFYVSVFILVMVSELTLSILFNDNENKFDVVLYLVTIATVTVYNGLFINSYVFLIVVTFNLMINENDIVIYPYIYDIKYQFRIVFCNNSGPVWNSSSLLNRIVFLPPITVWFKYGIHPNGLQQHLVHRSNGRLPQQPKLLVYQQLLKILLSQFYNGLIICILFPNPFYFKQLLVYHQ